MRELPLYPDLGLLPEQLLLANLFLDLDNDLRAALGPLSLFSNLAVHLECQERLLNLGVRLVLVYLPKHMHIIDHALPDPRRVHPVELGIVLAETDLLHGDNDVRSQHQVLHALHILPMHFH